MGQDDLWHAHHGLFDGGQGCLTDSDVPSGDAHGAPLLAEVVAQAAVDESFYVGRCNLKLVMRPTLADIHVVTVNSEDGPEARRHLRERLAYHPKYEPWMDLDEVS